MVVMWLTLFVWLHGVCNAPERLNIHILIVAEHLGGCVADQNRQGREHKPRFGYVDAETDDRFIRQGQKIAAACMPQKFVSIYPFASSLSIDGKFT